MFGVPRRRGALNPRLGPGDYQLKVTGSELLDSRLPGSYDFELTYARRMLSRDRGTPVPPM